MAACEGKRLVGEWGGIVVDRREVIKEKYRMRV
jgi:hypothetical protein